MVCLDLFAREPAVMLWDTAGALTNRVLKFWSVAGVFGALVPVNLHTDRVSHALGHCGWHAGLGLPFSRTGLDALECCRASLHDGRSVLLTDQSSCSGHAWGSHEPGPRALECCGASLQQMAACTRTGLHVLGHCGALTDRGSDVAGSLAKGLDPSVQT